MDNPLTPKKQDAILEDALHTYPVLPIPRDITVDVMARIQTVPAPHPFRLTWSDLILSGVLALCVGALWFSVQNLPPLVIAHLRKESILLYHQVLVNARWLIPVLSFGLAGLLAALTIPYVRREFMK
jgi:hypothetical protein